MEYALLGVLVLAIFGSFFIAYMSSKTWPIYQAVLVVFVFLGTVAFFYLSARTLATHKAWRDLVKAQQTQLASLEDQIKPIVGGTNHQGQSFEGEIARLGHGLSLAAKARGGAFFDVAADGIKGNTVSLTFASPNHGLAPKTVLYAFDQRTPEEGGRYLGEFSVVNAAEDSPNVQIAPALPLSPEQAKRLAGAVKGTWTLYTMMPMSSPTLDKAARAVLASVTSTDAAPGQEPGQEPPADAAAAPAADAAAPPPAEGEQPGGAKPPKKIVVPPATEHEMIDYGIYFHENYVQRTLLTEAINQFSDNISRMETAAKEAAAESAYREQDKANLEADLKNFKAEQAAIAAYQKTLERMLQTTLETLKKTYLENRQSAANLTTAQLRAAGDANRRASTDTALAQ